MTILFVVAWFLVGERGEVSGGFFIEERRVSYGVFIYGLVCVYEGEWGGVLLYVWSVFCKELVYIVWIYFYKIVIIMFMYVCLCV